MPAETVEQPAVVFATRPMRESDSAYLYANFLRPYRESDYTEGIPNAPFFDYHKQEWAIVLKRFNVLIAHPEGSDDEIAGFIAWSGRCVAWLYTTKTPWRGMGVATRLLNEAGFGDGEPFHALYGSSWALSRARSHGYRVTLAPHCEALMLLLEEK